MGTCHILVHEKGKGEGADLESLTIALVDYYSRVLRHLKSICESLPEDMSAPREQQKSQMENDVISSTYMA